ncbi:ribonuclease H-like domain-containing protein [Tanacetum coccineum]
MVDLNPTTAKDAWTYIEAIFQDNKRPRAMALKAELSNLKLGDLSIDGYFQKIESIVSVLNVLVPLLAMRWCYTSARRGPSLGKVNNPCWSFAKGSCRFGDACKYLHNGVHGKSTLLPRTSGSASSVPGVTRSDLDMLQSLLAKFGLNAPNISTPSPPVAYTVSVPPGFQSVSAQLSAQPTYVSPQLLPGSFGVSNMGMAGLFPQGVQYGNSRLILVDGLSSELQVSSELDFNVSSELSSEQQVATTTAAAVATTAGSSSTTTAAAVATSVTHHRSSSSHHRSSSSHRRHSSSHHTPGQPSRVAGNFEDLIETWRKGHSKKNGQFKTEENKARYEEMKAMKDHIRAGIILFKTDHEILDEIVPSDNRQNMSGRGRKLPGGGLTSRRYANRAFGDVMSREQITQLYRQEQQEKELYRKQAEEAQARAWLAAQKADAAQRRADQTHDILEAERTRYTLQTNPHMNDLRTVEELARDLARDNNNESSSGEEEVEESGGDYSDED